MLNLYQIIKEYLFSSITAQNERRTLSKYYFQSNDLMSISLQFFPSTHAPDGHQKSNDEDKCQTMMGNFDHTSTQTSDSDKETLSNNAAQAMSLNEIEFEADRKTSRQETKVFMLFFLFVDDNSSQSCLSLKCWEISSDFRIIFI